MSKEQQMNWIDSDYELYLNRRAKDDKPLSLDLWLCKQTPEYRVVHAADIAASRYRRAVVRSAN